MLNSGLYKNNTDAELKFFLNEVKNMMSIQGHDKILPILGALPYTDTFPDVWKVDQNGIPCEPHAIVMPFMPHGTLEDLLEKPTKIPLQRKFDIALEVCEGTLLCLTASFLIIYRKPHMCDWTIPSHHLRHVLGSHARTPTQRLKT